MISCEQGEDYIIGRSPNDSASVAKSDTDNFFPCVLADEKMSDAFSQLGVNSSSLCHNTGPIAPTVARFISSGGPNLTEALVLADKIHLALVKLSNGSCVFTGCDGSRRPLRGNSHAYIICESDHSFAREEGEITHVTVFAPMGFGSTEQKALRSMHEVWGSWKNRVHLQLQGIGRQEDFFGPDHSSCPLMAKSRDWISLTPFLPTRHPKITRAGVPKRDVSGLQIGSPEHELRRLLNIAHFPRPIAIDSIPYSASNRLIWSRFRIQRGSGHGRRAGSQGYGFRIKFPEPVQGPIAVGYAAHFGMGVFMPVADLDLL